MEHTDAELRTTTRRTRRGFRVRALGEADLDLEQRHITDSIWEPGHLGRQVGNQTFQQQQRGAIVNFRQFAV